MTQLHIDLNADLGETCAGIPVADDEAMLNMVSSANVATGFHAGDPHTIMSTLRRAAAHKVVVGAHIAYHDLAGFGRRFIDYNPGELSDEITYQIGALQALATASGTTVRYVKPHGALYNTIVHHTQQAQAVIDGVKAFGDLPLVLLPGSVAADMAEKQGMTVIREAFADRSYNPDGTLVARTQPNAVLHDPTAVVNRVLQVATTGAVTAVDGTIIPADAHSICTHGDSPGAVELLRSVLRELAAKDIQVRSFLS